MKNSRFSVTGMGCAACSARVEKCVSQANGVTKVSVNLLAGEMEAEYDETVLTEDDIVKIVKEAGYGAEVIEQENIVKKNSKLEENGIESLKKEAFFVRIRLILSVVFWLLLLYAARKDGVMHAYLQVAFLIPIVVLNYKYFTNGLKMLLKKSPNMDTLVAMGSGAAIVYGVFGHGLHFECAGTILTLITIGKYLEARSKGKTGEAIQKLMKLVPETVSVIRDGAEVVVEADELRIGEIFVVRPGERIGADGVVLEGHSTVDESALTGESIPAEKTENSQVLSASMNLNGTMKIKAMKVGNDTAFAKILEIVDKAGASKAPIARLADKIAGVFVPVVMAIAFVTGVVWVICTKDAAAAISSAIAVLVVSCPCALGLATPVAIMVGTGKGAMAGLLIKTGEALEKTHGVDVVVLDKTGTVTNGKPSVTDVVTKDGKEIAMLEIAYALESFSEHPLADAIIRFCNEKNIQKNSCTNFQAIPGKGVKAHVNGKLCFGGNDKMIAQEGLVLPDKMAEDGRALAELGKTLMFFADENEVYGFIAVADVIKPTSKEAIDKLKALSVEVVMLTGDDKLTADAIAKEVGIGKVYAGVLPEEKGLIIEDLKKTGKVVAMVGDGINDAPALMLSDVGIAIGAGSDVAIESADIILMKNDLLDVVNAIKLSKAVIRNIKQNLFWAFFYNCIGIPLAAGVFYPLWQMKLSPEFGAFAMSMSSLFVVTNALRLRYLKLEK